MCFGGGRASHCLPREGLDKTTMPSAVARKMSSPLDYGPIIYIQTSMAYSKAQRTHPDRAIMGISCRIHDDLRPCVLHLEPFFLPVDVQHTQVSVLTLHPRAMQALWSRPTSRDTTVQCSKESRCHSSTGYDAGDVYVPARAVHHQPSAQNLSTNSLAAPARGERIATDSRVCGISSAAERGRSQRRIRGVTDRLVGMTTTVRMYHPYLENVFFSPGMYCCRRESGEEARPQN